MTTDFLTVDADGTLADAIGEQLAAGVETSVITIDGDPAGLLTPRAALRLAFETGKPLDEIPLRQLATGFDVTLPPHTTELFAIATMIKNDASVIPVIEGLHVRGILTQNDIMAHITTFRKEAIDANRPPPGEGP